MMAAQNLVLDSCVVPPKPPKKGKRKSKTPAETGISEGEAKVNNATLLKQNNTPSATPIPPSKWSGDRFAWARAVRRKSGLHLRAVVVAQYLAERANSENQAWPSRETIAKNCGLKLRTVDNALADLKSAGLLIAVRTGGRTKLSGVTLLTLAVPDSTFATECESKDLTLAAECGSNDASFATPDGTFAKAESTFATGGDLHSQQFSGCANENNELGAALIQVPIQRDQNKESKNTADAVKALAGDSGARSVDATSPSAAAQVAEEKESSAAAISSPIRMLSEDERHSFLVAAARKGLARLSVGRGKPDEAERLWKREEKASSFLTRYGNLFHQLAIVLDLPLQFDDGESIVRHTSKAAREVLSDVLIEEIAERCGDADFTRGELNDFLATNFERLN